MPTSLAIWMMFGVIGVWLASRLMAARKVKQRIPAIRAAIETGARLFDVRSPSEYIGGHHPGARNVPVGDLRDRACELGDKQRPLIVYCQSGSRSGRAAKALAELGFAKVLDAGGIGNLAGLPAAREPACPERRERATSEGKARRRRRKRRDKPAGRGEPI